MLKRVTWRKVENHEIKEVSELGFGAASFHLQDV
jgi:hypothetical protein